MGASSGHCACGGRDFPGILHDMTDPRHVVKAARCDQCSYTRIAPMPKCGMGAISEFLHVCCTYFYYSHSFTPVCRGIISAHSSLLIGFSGLAAESRRMSPRGRLGQNMGQPRELFAARGRAVSFLSPGQKRARFWARKALIESIGRGPWLLAPAKPK